MTNRFFDGKRGESPVSESLTDRLKPLSPEDRKKAREAFHEVMNTHDEDPLAIAAAVTLRSMLLAKKKSKQDEKATWDLKGRRPNPQ